MHTTTTTGTTLGTWHGWQAMRHFARDPIACMSALQATHGDRIALQLGLRRVLFVFHPSDVAQILRRDAEIFGRSRLIFDKIVPLTGRRGLVQLDGDAGHQARRQTGTAVGAAAVTAAYPDLIANANAALVDLDAAAQSGTPIDMGGWVTQLVLQNACRVLLGPGTARCAPLAEAFLAVHRLCGPGLRRFGPALPYRGRTLRRATEALRQQAHAWLDASTQGIDSPDLVSALAAHRLPREEACDHLLTYLFAAYETTAASLVWTLYLLARQPSTCAAVAAEGRAVWQGDAPEQADLAHLATLRQVVQESMRLFPPAWLLARQADRDTHVGTTPVRRGTVVLIGVNQVHRHPAFWTEPNAFHPERFADAAPPTGAYVPFGLGARNCVGMRLGMLEAQLILAMLTRRYRLALAPDWQPEIAALITAHPHNPMRMRVEKD